MRERERENESYGTGVLCGVCECSSRFCVLCSLYTEQRQKGSYIATRRCFLPFFLNYETFFIHMYNRECELRYFKILKSVNIFNDSVNKRGGTGICLILKIDDVWVAYYLFRGELS